MTRDDTTEIDPTLPFEVRHLVKELFERTEIMPTVTREGMCTIHLEHSNERVRMTQKYVRPIGSKRWRWHSAELWENGTQRPTVNGVNRYVAIFLGTENDYLGRKKTELVELTPLPSDHEIPLGIRNTVRKMETHMQRKGATVGYPRVALEGERYTIEMTGPAATVRIYYEAHHHGSGTARCYREDQSEPFRVVRHDGMDITEEVMDDPAMRAALMAGDTSALNTPDHGGGKITNTMGARSNAVETRRATVVRV